MTNCGMQKNVSKQKPVSRLSMDDTIEDNSQVVVAAT